MKTKQISADFPVKLARLLIISIFLLPWMTLLAQDFTKTYQGNYDVDKGANLVIQNKFGNIQCQAWDQSNVSINVTVKVDASSQEKADKVFNKIGVEISGSRTSVQGITTVGNMNNADYSIDYEVRMPRWINIDLDNQFGDIYLDEADGSVKINLEYGAMEANALNGPKTELTIKFSDAEAGYMKDADVKLEYSEWKSKGAENLVLNSRFGEVSIGKVAKLNLDSQYDEVNVESVGQLISVSRFSELEFGKLTGDFDFDIEYGGLEVNYISAEFKVGKIRNSFAEADLTFDPKASMNVNAELEFGDLSYPKGNASLNHVTENYTNNIYKGKIGASASPSSQLTIVSKNSDVSIDFED
jgi:hypothetical protein